MSSLEKLRSSIRDVVNFPKDGILFKDITPILSDSELCKYVIDNLTERLSDHRIDAIAGI